MVGVKPFAGSAVVGSRHARERNRFAFSRFADAEGLARGRTIRCPVLPGPVDHGRHACHASREIPEADGEVPRRRVRVAEVVNGAAAINST